MNLIKIAKVQHKYLSEVQLDQTSNFPRQGNSN